MPNCDNWIKEILYMVKRATTADRAFNQSFTWLAGIGTQENGRLLAHYTLHTFHPFNVKQENLTRRCKVPAEVDEMLLERDGSVIPDQARRPCRGEGHFKELLNHAATPNAEFSPSDNPEAKIYHC